MEQEKKVLSHKEKLNNLFNTILGQQKYDGEEINLETLWQSRGWESDGINGNQEVLLYFETLLKMGVIDFQWKKILYNSPQLREPISLNVPGNGHITFKGLEYAIQIQEEGQNSNKCFVAMRFIDDYKKKLVSIKKACKKYNYDAFIVQDMPEKILETINDKIIAGIKMSKFVIADLTHHSNGAYFEAGYALGRNMKVILTCEAKHFKKAHFDINHYPVIVYNNLNELTEKLNDKIASYIEK